jgi:chromosome segregation protein
VLAQPPGKKNSSIHLLSGGEKALTALSLVFAFFRLNPAPFCLLDEVDAPLDDSNTERYCALVSKMSAETQFLFITHNRITMEMAHNLVGVTMPEPGVSRRWRWMWKTRPAPARPGRRIHAADEPLQWRAVRCPDRRSG